MNKPDKLIGITSTIPVEVIYASGYIPVDLNNLFIRDQYPQKLIEYAERAGLPRNTCAWVKGLYSTILKHKVNTVIGVVQGDCTPIVTMLETLLPVGIDFLPFGYPYEKDRELLRVEIQKLMILFGVQWDTVEETREKLNHIRELAHKIDYLTWHDNNISSEDNFYSLVNCTDFKSNPDMMLQELNQIINQASRVRIKSALRLGMIGIPGVFNDLYSYLESRSARIVFHEIARQFAMPNYHKDLLDQYLTYTYPYSVYGRLNDIKEQTEVRQLDGYIHYVQSFCHHHLEDAVFKKHLDLPVLTLEGDQVGPIDGRTKTRIDAFLEMLNRKKSQKNY